MSMNDSIPGKSSNSNTVDTIQKDFGNYAGDSKVNSVIQVVLYVYTLPIFICMGIFGNIVVLYVVRKSVFSRYSVTVYIKAYAIANILSMVFNSSMDWTYIILDVRHFKNNSETICRIWQFVIRVVTYSGIWFVVAMATDRYIIVWHGHRKKQLCTIFNAKVTVCLIVVGMVTLSIHAMWTYEVDKKGWCTITDESFIIKHDVHKLIWRWVSGMLYSIVPILCIFVLGNAIVIKQCCQDAVDEKESTELTRTVTFVCYSNFILNTPATVINILDNTLPSSDDPQNGRIMEIIRDSMILLVCFNYVEILTAFLMCSKVFRDTIYKMFHCPQKPESIAMECTAV